MVMANEKTRMGATSDNTAYTLRATPLPFGTLLPTVATSYIPKPLGDIAYKIKERIENV